jgi:hypothetical protein
MAAKFKITDYGGGPVSKFCGVRISQRLDGSFALDQQVYIEELLERLDFTSLPDHLSPEATGTKARLHPRSSLSSTEQLFMSSVPYREAVGALWWLARLAAPAVISFALVSRWQHTCLTQRRSTGALFSEYTLTSNALALLLLFSKLAPAPLSLATAMPTGLAA